jgi:hypothetical protein
MYLLPQRRPLQRIIITTNWKTGILQLKISARCKIIEDLLANCAVVFEACDHGACVDIIERLMKSPIILGIVDLELAICGRADCKLMLTGYPRIYDGKWLTGLVEWGLNQYLAPWIQDIDPLYDLSMFFWE